MLPLPGLWPAAGDQRVEATPADRRQRMKQQGKQTRRGTSQRGPAPPTTVPQPAGKPDETRRGVAKPGEQDDLGQGATDYHQSNHGKRGR
jgi:hypothetical protein